MARPVNFYPFDLVGSAAPVQASGIESLTAKLQSGAPSEDVGFLDVTEPTVDKDMFQASGIEQRSNSLLAHGGIDNSGYVLNPSFLFAPQSTVILQPDEDLESPLFMQGVVGTTITITGTISGSDVVVTGTLIDQFFDRSPFHLESDHGTDPNTERDLSEVSEFLVFSTAIISTYPVTGRIPAFANIIVPTVSSAGDDFLTNKTTSPVFINSNPPALEQVVGAQGIIDTPTATGTFTTIEGPISISGTLDITQEDGSAPFFDEQVPVADSRFNDPNAVQVEFHIKDNGAAGLDTGTMDVFIDGLQVVAASATVTGTIWPTASRSVLSPNNYQFIFTRGVPFDQQSVVTVSGNLGDIPGNTTATEYSFYILGSGTLVATISGAIDADPPVITPTNPVDLQTQVSPDTSLIWTLVDNAAGVDATSVKLYINGLLRLDNATVTSGTFSRTGRAQGGFTYTFNPSEQFSFGSTVTGTIQATDLATIPNTDSLEYSFVISPTDSLNIQNFFLADGESTLLTSGTEISVDVVDTLYGVDVAETFMTVNGVIPAGLNTTVITSGIRFSVPAVPLIDFREELLVFVHAENQFPGIFPQIEEQLFTLHPGYDVNWPNIEANQTETLFPYLANVVVLTDVKNFAKNFKAGSAFYQVLVEPEASFDLGASIESNVKTAELSAALESLNPFFEYGKTIVLEIEVDDLEGNQLRFEHTFIIESRP
jgi:hypothetical protein